MATSTVEDYVKQVYLLSAQSFGTKPVPMGKLARALTITPGTATTMIKALSDSGLVMYEPRVGVRLTPGGEKLALHVLRRHRLVELLLVEVLGLDWSEVHEEAERLEHAVSEKVLERIDVLLNRPKRDPHGDPIPSPEGNIVDASHKTLMDCSVGSVCTVDRILDQDPDFLTFIERAGLIPGSTVLLEERNRIADAVTVDVRHGDRITIGTSVAVKVAVMPGDKKKDEG